ncbi:glutathione-disulfide reductase [Saprolegnia parasitica CBS 223.65]|uniref:Glutathione reductase n=1 Tax=Saprolegnia parasitica (strain CBS 223.65) TaxID=695850 RepID=A0A067C1C9_SAPPC|nr:glutathione-disulfide reductase [Saprolegnia parasitica CBS 223.65]KDO22925.1 glutathione-disulfide reductase [Saprolegnia parasitica CBS 223.65]|eukprot:XP_012206362.1 glutathione-disulfide reductase [Saprolegnia parasitica CBS 223.65]
MQRMYDLVVMGGGSGGIASARRAATYGKKVLVVERGRLGGTCVNVGCVPKKVMYAAADLAHSMRHDAPAYGFPAVPNTTVDWATLKQRRDAYVTRLNGIYARNLQGSGVDFAHGLCSFGSDGRRGDERLVAVGGQPVMPDIPGIEHCISSDGFFELDERPARVAVVGAGYIAVELAGVLRGLGSDTTIFCRQQGVLRSFDDMLQSVLHDAFKRDGITLQPHSTVARVDKVDPATGTLSLTTTAGDYHTGFDCVLVATGRTPMTKHLGLEHRGIELSPNGFIPVDAYQATSAPGVFALGDVVNTAALTPVAIAAGRRLADRLFGGLPDAKADYTSIPSVVFSHPPIGTIGLTEQEARKVYREDEIKVYSSKFVNMHYSLYEHAHEKPTTAMKLICVGPTEKIVGLHVIGRGADEMLQGFGVAIKMGACKKDLDACIAIHPTAAEELVTLAPWGL